MDNNVEGKLDQSINNLLVTAEELRKLSGQLGGSGTEGSVQDRLNEAQWYLGEEKAKRQQLEESLQDKESCIRQMSEEIRNLKQQLNEAQWYLGEERAKLQQMENRMKTA